MEQYTIKAYAKVNLGLDVVNRLPNGYHQVKMIMQTVGIYDELTMEKTESGIIVTTDSGELPTDENNLIYKAAKLMQEKYGIREGVRIHLQKNIPIAAGMAGGSTDAAATMKGMNILFGLEAKTEELMAEAVKIGADVPYCIMGGTALAEGIGEKLTALPPVPKIFLLVAKPDINVSTKYVYEHLDAEGIAHHPDIDGMVEAIREGSLQGILERMENVLETVTIPAHPVIEVIKKRMRELGAADSLMSGSGPTVFGVFPDEEGAKKAYEQMRQDGLAKQIFLTTPV
ncbi:MAG: 4-(cytidine 5'-diphospho)-2-C-methyl-D-erythritol kinase [Acetatifactor sp.]